MRQHNIKFNKDDLVILIPSFLIFLWLFLIYYHPINSFTQDLGRHLLLGKLILENGYIPETNLFSYTYPDFRFINHHWLSEVIFYLISTLSMHLLLVTSAVSATLSILIPYVFSYKKYKNILILVIGVLAVGVMKERIAIRPEMFSFLFTGIYITILYYYRDHKTNIIYALPILSLIWIQMHIYFFVGLLIIGIFLSEQIFFYFFTKRTGKLKALTMVFIISVCISVLNPNSISGLTYPLTVFNNYGYGIEENQSMFFLESLGITKLTALYFKIFSILGLILLIVNFKRSRFVDWVLYFVFIGSGLTAVRNFPLPIIVLIIPMTRYLSYTYENILKMFDLKSSKIFVLNIIIALFVSVLSTYNIYQLFNEKKVGYTVKVGAEKALDFYINNGIRGPIFNNFDIGSYIIYRLYPDQKVFVDGRPEAYPSDFFRQVYIPMQESSDIFNDVSNKYKFNAIIFSHTDQTPWANQFFIDIWNNNEWVPIYLDETIIIFIKNIEENKDLIDKFKIDKNNIKYNINTEEIMSYLQIASFFSKINSPEDELKIYDIILKKDPNNCLALRNSAIVSGQLNNNLGPLYASRYSASCK